MHSFIRKLFLLHRRLAHSCAPPVPKKIIRPGRVAVMMMPLPCCIYMHPPHAEQSTTVAALPSPDSCSQQPKIVCKLMVPHRHPKQVLIAVEKERGGAQRALPARS